MSRIAAALLASSLVFGCDPAPSEADEADLDGLVGGALGKSDSGAIEGALGDALTLSVTRKTPGAATTSAHAKAIVFEVPQGEAFAVVMRDRSRGGVLTPWLQLHDSDGLITTAQWGQGVVWDGSNDDAVILYRARETTRFVAVAADRELAADGDFQLDVVPIAAVPIDASKTGPGEQALMTGIRSRDGNIEARDTVVEDGMGRLLATDETPLRDRNTINGVNAARDDYFEWMADETGVPEDALRETIGGLWGELSLGPFTDR